MRGMKKCMLSLLAAAVPCLAPAEPVADAVAPPCAADVRLSGYVAAKMDALVRERFMTDFARAEIYDEAENAFRTHYDDLHTKGYGWWQGEYWGKTMLSAAEVYSHTRDEGLKNFILEKTHRFLAGHQRPDGYVGSYNDARFVRVEGRPARQSWCWNIWGRKYTMWALYDIYRHTGDRACLDAAVKSMDQMLAMLKEMKLRFIETGSFYGIPSSSILKPLLLLYRETGKPAYLEAARSIVEDFDRPGHPHGNIVADAFGDIPIHEWHQEPFFWAKAYETQSCMEGLIEYHRVTGERRPLEAVKRLHAKLVAHELNPMAGVGYFDHFVDGGHRPNSMTEPCDVTHWIRVNRELYLLTGEAHYLDRIEKAFYNAFLAGVYRDGKWGAHAVRSHGRRHRTAPHQVGMKYHQCCIDNMPRTFIDWIATQLGRQSDGAIDINFYSDMTASLDGVKVAISGNYPVSDSVTVRVTADRARRVRFRVPGWSRMVKVNGADARGPWHEVDVPKGESAWRIGFDMTPVVVSTYVQDTVFSTDSFYGQPARNWLVHVFESANENPEMKGLSRKEGAAFVMRGPLLLARCTRAGGSPDEILKVEKTINHGGFEAAAAPRPNANVWGAWTLTLKSGKDVRTAEVADYASAADTDDAENAFSIWF